MRVQPGETAIAEEFRAIVNQARSRIGDKLKLGGMSNIVAHCNLGTVSSPGQVWMRTVRASSYVMVIASSPP